MSDRKEHILAKIQKGKEKAKLWNVPFDSTEKSYFKVSNEDLIQQLKSALDKINANLIVVSNLEEQSHILLKLFSNTLVVCKDTELQSLLEKEKISFSSKIDKSTNPMGFIACDYLVARLGSVLTTSAINSGRELNIFPEHQVILARKKQLVYDIEDAIAAIKTKYPSLPSMISFATGPSRTADIEKTLILGAHGPKKLTIIYQNFD